MHLRRAFFAPSPSRLAVPDSTGRWGNHPSAERINECSNAAREIIGVLYVIHDMILAISRELGEVMGPQYEQRGAVVSLGIGEATALYEELEELSFFMASRVVVRKEALAEVLDYLRRDGSDAALALASKLE